jgi:dolichol-phosphate mannosyltransferase
LIRVVIPAFNEASGMQKLLDDLAAALERGGRSFELVVVDDGSSDETAAIVAREAAKRPIVLVRHPENRGLGAALETGLTAALARSAPDDMILTLDADNSHPPELIETMVQKLDEGFDVVIASRFQPGGRMIGVPWERRLFSHGASGMLRVVFPTHGVRDYTCGFRLYRARVLMLCQAEGGLDFSGRRGFESMLYLLLRLRGVRAAIAEVPLVLRYDLKGGPSKMKVARTIRDTMKMIVSMRLGR